MTAVPKAYVRLPLRCRSPPGRGVPLAAPASASRSLVPLRRAAALLVIDARSLTLHRPARPQAVRSLTQHRPARPQAARSLTLPRPAPLCLDWRGFRGWGFRGLISGSRRSGILRVCCLQRRSCDLADIPARPAHRASLPAARPATANDRRRARLFGHEVRRLRRTGNGLGRREDRGRAGPSRGPHRPQMRGPAGIITTRRRRLTAL